KIRRISCTRSATRIEITPAFVAYRIAATMQHGIYAPATLRFAFPHSLDPEPTVDSAAHFRQLPNYNGHSPLPAACGSSAEMAMAKIGRRLWLASAPKPLSSMAVL
ncbi:hypothetical protein, partial [Burkholderia vietnamiensis]|uniref:hypothetical protein n=1 Tax=Burkholderia vietnamiensis TaxID=60552 RepID=UPI001F18AD3A